jgi:hypothetical protein
MNFRLLGAIAAVGVYVVASLFTQAQTPAEKYQYVVWFSYCDGKPLTPGTPYATEGEAQQSANSMRSTMTTKGKMYCDVQVFRTAAATPSGFGDVLKQYKDEIVNAYKRVVNAKQYLLSTTGQITIKQFNDVNKLIAEFNQQYDAGAKQGWSSAFSGMGVQRVDPVNAEGSRKYTVLVYQDQGGQWVRDDSRSIVSNDLESVQDYVVQVKSVRGWTATTNAPEPEFPIPGTYVDWDGDKNSFQWTTTIKKDGTFVASVKYQNQSGTGNGQWKVENGHMYIRWQAVPDFLEDTPGTPKWVDVTDKYYRKTPTYK